MPTTTLPRGNTRNFERVLVGGEPQTVALDELQVDESYQRNRLNYHIRQMCDNFMELAIAAPVVGRRSDNSLWVIDGQQRLEAARREGYDAALVLIVDSTGPEFEAAIFRWLNNRRGISAAIIFRCNVKANDPDTLCIKDIVERTGFRFQGISPVNGGLTIGCIGEIVRTYHERGADQLELLLQIALVRGVGAMVACAILFWVFALSMAWGVLCVVAVRWLKTRQDSICQNFLWVA